MARMIFTVRKWSKRHAGLLAVVFGAVTAVTAVTAVAAVAAVLAVVVCLQAIMLHTRGWRFVLGTLPEYLAAVGSLATFGVLGFAAREWRRGEVERCDSAAGQARLIIVDHVPFVSHSFGGQNPPPPGQREVVIHNRSTEPVFALQIEEYAADSDVRVFQRSANAGVRLTPRDMPVLEAGQSTDPIGVLGGEPDTSNTEHVEFTFTDPRQGRWRRRRHRAT